MQKYPIGSKFLIIILSLFFIVGCGAAEKKNVAGKPTAAVTESYIAVTVSGSGQHTLKIWMVDPGVVVDKIVIGNAPASHVGPPETAIQ